MSVKLSRVDLPIPVLASNLEPVQESLYSTWKSKGTVESKLGEGPWDKHLPNHIILTYKEEPVTNYQW